MPFQVFPCFFQVPFFRKLKGKKTTQTLHFLENIFSQYFLEVNRNDRSYVTVSRSTDSPQGPLGSDMIERRPTYQPLLSSGSPNDLRQLTVQEVLIRFFLAFYFLFFPFMPFFFFHFCFNCLSLFLFIGPSFLQMFQR